MSETIFFRLLDGVNRPSRLSDAVKELREGGEMADAYSAEPASFQQVPGSPFAYWVSSGLRSKFTELSPFESKGRTVKQGLSTADDSRFVRAWWEVASAQILDSGDGPQDDAKNLQKWCRERTSQGKGWVPFANGGERSPYYADIHLVLRWEQDGQEMKSFERAVVRNPK